MTRLTLNPWGLTRRRYALRVLEWTMLAWTALFAWEIAVQLHEFTSGPDCFGRGFWAIPETTDFKQVSTELIGSMVIAVAADHFASRSS